MIVKNNSEYEIINPHVDQDYYFQTYPDTKEYKGGAVSHFIDYGWKEGRNPNSKFDTKKYLMNNPDVAAAEINPLLHCVLNGLIGYDTHEGESADAAAAKHAALLRDQILEFIRPHVDEDYYFSHNPDTREYPGGAVAHYVDYGWREGRNPSFYFNTKDYLLRNPSVAANGDNPLFHYVTNSDQTEVQSDQDPIDNPDLRNSIDKSYYYARNVDIALAGVDPVEHYLKHGAAEGRAPNLWFDASFYNSIRPRDNHADLPDFIHYMKFGKRQGLPKSCFSTGAAPFDQFCRLHGWQPETVEKEIDERRQSIVDRLLHGELGKQVAMLADVDPLIMSSYDAALQFQFSPYRSSNHLSCMSAMLQAMNAANWRPAQAAIVLPWVHMGGSSKIAGVACQVLVDRYGAENVVIIHTDTSEFDYDQRFPEGVRIIDLHAVLKEVARDDRPRVLFEYVRALRPAIMLNINSALCWDMVVKYGQPLGNLCKIFVYLFCPEKNVRGHWYGYPIEFYHRSLPYIDAVLVDSQALKNELSGRYHLSSKALSRIHVLDTPTDPDLPQVKVRGRKENQRPNVFWGGRFAPQKRIDILTKIAKNMPEVDFQVWGGSNWPMEKPSNLILNGSYRNITEIPLQDCDVWLYTSGWDGVPNMLIEVATIGLPLVSSVVGGTGEIATADAAIPVYDVENINDYIAAIRSILDDPRAAQQRADLLRKRTLGLRTPSHYSDALNAIIDAGDYTDQGHDS